MLSSSRQVCQSWKPISSISNTANITFEDLFVQFFFCKYIQYTLSWGFALFFTAGMGARPAGNPPRGEGGVPRPAPHCGEGGVPRPAPPRKNDQNRGEVAGQNKYLNLNFLQKRKQAMEQYYNTEQCPIQPAIGYARESKKWEYFGLFLLTGHQTLFSKICQRMK